jgi:hypothetical protein
LKIFYFIFVVQCLLRYYFYLLEFYKKNGFYFINFVASFKRLWLKTETKKENCYKKRGLAANWAGANQPRQTSQPARSIPSLSLFFSLPGGTHLSDSSPTSPAHDLPRPRRLLLPLLLQSPTASASTPPLFPSAHSTFRPTPPHQIHRQTAAIPRRTAADGRLPSLILSGTERPRPPFLVPSLSLSGAHPPRPPLSVFLQQTIDRDRC